MGPHVMGPRASPTCMRLGLGLGLRRARLRLKRAAFYNQTLNPQHA